MSECNKCVHTEHCCKYHGCKYGDENCPVAIGEKKQSFTCEYCWNEGIRSIEELPDCSSIIQDRLDNLAINDYYFDCEVEK